MEIINIALNYLNPKAHSKTSNQTTCSLKNINTFISIIKHVNTIQPHKINTNTCSKLKPSNSNYQDQNEHNSNQFRQTNSTLKPIKTIPLNQLKQTSSVERQPHRETCSTNKVEPNNEITSYPTIGMSANTEGPSTTNGATTITGSLNDWKASKRDTDPQMQAPSTHKEQYVTLSPQMSQQITMAYNKVTIGS